MIIPLYFNCNSCGQVAHEEKWKKLSIGRFKCTYCKQTQKQVIWPEPEIRNLLEFVSNFDNKSPHYPRIACVFLSSVIELFLENLLIVMAFQDLLYEEASMLVDALFEGYQGRSRMLMLYSKIGYGTFHQAVKLMGKSQFLNDWDTIVESRNNVLHGRINICKGITPDLVERTILNALDVFTILHNQYNTESLHYKIATNK